MNPQPHTADHMEVALHAVCGLEITEFIKEVSPLLPNPCHSQVYERSMISPDQPGSEGCLEIGVLLPNNQRQHRTLHIEVWG